MLIAANLASIHSRYPDTADGGILPGPCAAYWDEPYVSRFVRPAPTAVEGLKLIDCFDYQACEPPGWPDSEAYAFCDALRSRLIRELDGYDAAPWGWPGKHDSPALAAGKDVSAPASTTYTLQEIRNGTGWPPAARFAVITAGVEERA